MIDIAYEAGADFIKFQTFKAKNLVSSFAQQIQRNTHQKIKINTLCKELEIPEKCMVKSYLTA